MDLGILMENHKWDTLFTALFKVILQAYVRETLKTMRAVQVSQILPVTMYFVLMCMYCLSSCLSVCLPVQGCLWSHQ